MEHNEYFPSGETWIDERQDLDNDGRQDYLFTGKELDPDTHLYYFGARYYDPQQGQWISADPILASYVSGEPNGGATFPQNLSLYTYSWNGPTGVRGPNGACPNCAAAGIGAALGAAAGAGAYLFHSWRSGEFSGRSLAAATAGGAVTGAIAGFTAGASLLVQGSAAVGGAVVGGGVSRGLETGSASAVLDPKAIAVDAVVGGVTFGVATGAGAGLKAVLGREAAQVTTSTEATELLQPHGDSLGSTKAQHVYEILETDPAGNTEVFKYGISGGKETAAGQSVRAQTQVRQLTRQNPGYSYESQVVERVQPGSGARVKALRSEKDFVEQYRSLTGQKPRGNKRP